PVDALRRDIAALGVGSMRVRESEEICEHRDQVEQGDDEQADQRQFVAAKPPPGQLELRRLREAIVNLIDGLDSRDRHIRYGLAGGCAARSTSAADRKPACRSPS